MKQPATVKTLGTELAGDMPQGSEHLKDGDTDGDGLPPSRAPAVAAAAAARTKGKGGKGKQPIDPAQYAHLKDKHGFKFDPEIHKTKADGTPKLTGSGLLWRKPGQRKKESQSFIHQGAPKAGPGEPGLQPGPGTEAAHYQASGQVMASMIFSIGQMFGGTEWAPKQIDGQIDEAAGMADAWATYFRAKGINDIPPGVAVAIAMAGYALPRLAQPNTKKKIGGLAAWFKNRKKKKPEPPPPATKEETPTKTAAPAPP